MLFAEVTVLFAYTPQIKYILGFFLSLLFKACIIYGKFYNVLYYYMVVFSYNFVGATDSRFMWCVDIWIYSCLPCPQEV